MKKNMLKGICTAAVCIALGTFASSNAHAAATNPNEKAISASFFQDSTMKHSKSTSGKGKMGGKMGGGRMSSDSSGGKMSGMKGKGRGAGRSKMDSTNHK